MSAESHPFAPFMAEAIQLAEAGRWRAAPNPTVGAVLVRDGTVVARGWHHAHGEAHAEVECLRDAAANGVDPSTCTMVVTLEPCNHQGKTPPCTEAVLGAGIPHMVIGSMDPNPIAAGGAERLRAAGVRVETDVCAQACHELLADFLVWQKKERPFVILKMASTLDGRIATRSGHSHWVSCAESRLRVHALRAAVGLSKGVVLVGGNTLLGDNPLLTARPDGDTQYAPQPLAAAVTSRLAGVVNLQLIQKRPASTLLYTTAAAAASPVAAGLRENGVRIMGIDPWRPRTGLDLGAVLAHLFSVGCPYVLCEGGGRLALALLDAGMVDEFHLHLAPKVLGDAAALPLLCGREPTNMYEALQLRITHMEQCGADCHLTLRPAPAQIAPEKR